MSIKNLEIKPSEAKAVEIASLPTRPTSSATYGGRGLTAQEMKKAYDAYPALIKERFNALIADLLSGIAISDIPFSIPSHEPFGENIEQTVKGFLDAVGAILDFGTDDARTIYGFVKQFVSDVAKATSLEYDNSTQLLTLTIDGEKKSVTFDFFDKFDQLETAIAELRSTVQTLDATKLDKFASTGGTYAYVSKGDGTQGNMLVGEGNVAFSIVCRDSTGRISVPSPKNDSNAVPKYYVDRNDTLIRFALQEQTERVDVLYTLLENTIINDISVEDTYTARVTAGGLPVVNNAPTTVHKIQGATVASKNLLDESQILPWTLPATTPAEQTEYTRAMPLTISAGTYTLSTSIAGGVQVTNSLSVFLRDASGNTVVDCNTASVNASSAASVFTVTEEQAGLITDIYFYVNLSAAELLGQTVDWVMLNGGETALPHEAYYAGVKQAYFKGIVSTGRNLITSLVTQSFSSGGVTVTPDAANGTVTINGSPDGNAASGRISPNFYLPKGTYTLYAPHRTMRFVGWHIRDLNNKNAGKIDWASNGGVISKTFTVTEAGYYYLYLYMPSGYNASFDNYVETPMLLPGEVTSDFPTFELYKEDTYFELSPGPVQLGKWDYVDVDNQKMHVQTATLTKETPFTDEELAQYSEYVLSADRKTVAYKTETETETDIGTPPGYTAYRGGLEMVEQGDTDNSAFGAENTITQNYYEEVTTS